jgi:hypothetical protein
MSNRIVSVLKSLLEFSVANLSFSVATLSLSHFYVIDVLHVWKEVNIQLTVHLRFSARYKNGDSLCLAKAVGIFSF